jgi:hypothetical protein
VQIATPTHAAQHMALPLPCRNVSVIKNESKLSALVDTYKQKQSALEDLADSWITSLRRKKAPKRKQVCSCGHLFCALSPLCATVAVVTL